MSTTVDQKTFKTTPYQHQMDALAAGAERESFGFLMEMGTGKSKCLIDNMAHLYLKGKINFALVILARCAPCLAAHLNKAKKMGLRIDRNVTETRTIRTEFRHRCLLFAIIKVQLEPWH